MNMTRINYVVDGKVYMVFNCNCFPKMTDFSRLGALQAVTYMIHTKSDSIKGMAQDRHIVTTQEVSYSLSVRAIFNDLG